MSDTSQSLDQQQRDAEREAGQAAFIVRGKEAAAQRQADARAVHAAEVAKRHAADDAMGIPRNWPEPRKHAARQKHANAQRAAQVAAEEAANPSKPTPRASLSRNTAPAAILVKLQAGSQRPGLAFGKG